MKISGIYKIQSIKFPKRCYVGSSYSIQRRWVDHLTALARGDHHSKKLQKHYDKYGKNDLVFSVLIGCEREDLITMEQFFLDSLKPYFNICPKAHSSLGRPPWNKGIKTGIKSDGSFKPGNVPWSKGKKWKLRKPRKPMSEAQRKSIGEHSKRMWAEKKAAGIKIQTGRPKKKVEAEAICLN